MDAISFVLGIKSSQLRSSQLRDLIYRGRILKESNGMNGRDDDDDEEDEPTQTQTQGSNGDVEERGPRRGWVMAVYQEDNGKQIRYKRTYVSYFTILTKGLHLVEGVNIGLIRRLSALQTISRRLKSTIFLSRREIFLCFRFCELRSN